MRSAIYLDAYVLACPPPEAGVATFGSYIQNLVQWTELRRTAWIDVYISRTASQVLAEANAYPPWPNLVNTISTLGLSYIQAHDVIELINAFLERAQSIEDVLLIDDLIFENFSISPQIPYQSRPVPFSNHFELLTTLLSMHRQIVADMQNQLLVTSPDLAIASSSIVETLITEVLPMDHGENYPLETPFLASVSFYICNCLHTLQQNIDPSCIWSTATCEFALRKAIELYIYQQHNDRVHAFSVVNFSFGSHFIQTVRDLGFFNEETKIRMLLRACSETLLNLNDRSTHWIRISSSGNSAQLKRGNDGAWRRDIDHEYHLHYWQTESGPQFAAVVPHNDCSIPCD